MSFVQDIIFILDQSGSMMRMGDEPCQSLNKFIKDQSRDKDGATFTLYTFDTYVNKVIDETPLQDVEEIHSLIPGGMTSLYDAIGCAISEKFKKEKNNNVICVILTDGLENSSNMYNEERIKELINLMETEYGWEFIYLGANQDSFREGDKVGISTCMNYNFTPESMRQAVNTASVGISHKRIASRNGEKNSKTILE